MCVLSSAYVYKLKVFFLLNAMLLSLSLILSLSLYYIYIYMYYIVYIYIYIYTNTLQNSSCTAPYTPSQKPSMFDEDNVEI